MFVLVPLLLLAGNASGADQPRHHRLWQCIHQREGAWNDPGHPYYGGLQMGWWFMRTYAPHLLRTKGTANHWTPLEQMQVAQRAYRSSGFSRRWLYHQWPNTAPPCARHA